MAQAELNLDGLGRLAGRRDTASLAQGLRLAVGESPEPRASIPQHEAETPTSAAPDEEPQTAEGDSSDG